MFETLSSYKCRLGGFNLYGLDDNGCEWFIPFDGVDGVFNGASSTLSTSTKLWTDGYFTNRAVHAGRTVNLTGYIHGNCFDDILTSWERFKARLPFREAVEFTTTLNGISRLMYVEYQGEPLISSEGNSLGKFSLTLVSRDALTYTPGDPLTGTTKLPSSEGGMTFPYVFNTFNTSLSTRWTGTANASTSTLSQDGQVVATNLYPNPSFDGVVDANVLSINGSSSIVGPGAITPYHGTKRISLGLGNDNRVGLKIPDSLLDSPVHIRMMVLGWTGGTTVSAAPNDGKSFSPVTLAMSDATAQKWVPFDIDFTPQTANFWIVFSSTTGSIGMDAFGVYAQSDWQAMQDLGVDWFSGDSYPRRWVFDETVVSGTVNLLTSGSGNSPVTIRFNGDVTNPQVLHVESGKILAYTGRIGAGHYVLFDGQSRQVLIDGATPARGAATRLEWFTAQQGVNTFQYSAERGEDTSTMTVSFREGWL